MENTGLGQKVQVWVFWRQSGMEPRVLLLRTHPGRGGFWQPVTGGAEAGEDPARAAVRELFEETGLRLEVIPLGYEFEFESRGRRFIEHVYYAEADMKDDPAMVPQVSIDPSEHDGWKWEPGSSAVAELRFESNAHALRLLLARIQNQKPR